MKKHILTATIRDLTGRKVKKLRAEGFIPATVYGKNVKSISITIAKDDFENVYRQAGETGLIELRVEGKKDVTGRQVLIHSVQVHPVTRMILHIELHQVDLKEKVHANVPLVLVGEAKAVADKVGVLLRLLDEIEVEALPAELPEKMEVDVTNMGEVDQEIKVSDLTIPSGVTLLSDPTVVVVKIGSLVTKEAKAEVKAAEEAAAAAAATQEAVTAEEKPGEAAEETKKESAPQQSTSEEPSKKE